MIIKESAENYLESILVIKSDKGRGAEHQK